jgi:choline-sulfatase
MANKEKPEMAMPIDGRSLWALAKGESQEDGEAIAEYCAECASHPMFMIRRGEYKYIHCDIDPPQLYNLINDPDELKNLVEDSEYKEIAQSFKNEIKSRWDSEAIRRNVIATQKQRRGIHAAMEAGILHSWDYNPPRDASNEFVRNHMDWLVAMETKRYPPHNKTKNKQ